MKIIPLLLALGFAVGGAVAPTAPAPINNGSVNLAVVTPLITSPSTTGLLTAEDLKTLTAPGGDLDTKLTTAQKHALAIGVDPMIVASIRLLGTNAPPSASDWLARLESSPSDLFLLAYADADLTLQRRAGAHEPLVPTVFPIKESLFPTTPKNAPVPSEAPTPSGETSIPTPESLVALNGSISGLAWPSAAGITEKDLDFISAGGYTRTLATSTNISGVVNSNPNVTIGKHQVTVSDSAISTLLRKAAETTTDSDWSNAMTSLTGLLSVTATAHPGATVIATLGRDGSASGPSLDKTLNALESLAWVNPVPLTAALAVPTIPAKLMETNEDSARDSTASALLISENATNRFATVVDEPTLVTGPQRLALLALLSTSWKDHPVGWASATNEYLAKNSRLRSSVHLSESSQITFPLEKGDLPIAVQNELDFPVTVYVRVQPERAILDVLNDRVELKIEANSQAKASVPVQSIANGEVRTMVTLSSASHKPISAPAFIILNVQAGWETVATVIVVIIVIGLFGAGIWRTVARRRKVLAQRAKTDESAL